MREKFRQRGYEQVKRFSWVASAQRVLEIYEEVATRWGAALEIRKIAQAQAITKLFVLLADSALSGLEMCNFLH